MAIAAFGLTIFTSSFLLFLVQPMVGRMLLPTLGGTPAVWNTCVFFFQATLLLGYGYAHWLTTRMKPQSQMLVHFFLLGAVSLALPFAVDPGAQPPSDSDPTIWLIGQLVALVGLPFFAISSTAPLLQRWFSLASRTHQNDPYFLYALSNIGSLAALLAYPFLIEPAMGLQSQTIVWAAGFSLLVCGFAGCGWLVRRGTLPRTCHTKGALSKLPKNAVASTSNPLGWRRRFYFILVAAIPSSLMLGVTSYITTDVGSIPMIWVIPLALYLISFIIAFSNRNQLLHRLFVRSGPYLLLLMPVLIMVDLGRMPWIVGGFHLLCFFVVATVCHGEIARLRPAVQQLTEYYFLMSIGGVVGGAINAFVAPQLFADVWEYPLMLVAAVACWPSVGASVRWSWRDLAIPAVLAATVLGAVSFWQVVQDEPNKVAMTLISFAMPAAVCFLYCLGRPVRFALCYAVLIFGSAWAIDGQETATSRRGFFGVNKVVVDRQHGYCLMINGRTMHGLQRLDLDDCEPLSYYHRLGPIGDVFRCAERFRVRRMAVIGLGAGSIGSYGQPRQSIDFFEIDPIVSDLAQDRRYFSYLQKCQADWQIVLGDARVQLSKMFGRYAGVTTPVQAGSDGRNRYDLIFMDAFSSDSIPSHLVTREAFELYLRGLRPNGAIAVNITNKHLDLRPLLAAIADELELTAVIRDDPLPGDHIQNGGRTSSVYVVITPKGAKNPWCRELTNRCKWVPLEADREIHAWTDDYVNFLDVLSW